MYFSYANIHVILYNTQVIGDAKSNVHFSDQSIKLHGFGIKASYKYKDTLYSSVYAQYSFTRTDVCNGTLLHTLRAFKFKMFLQSVNIRVTIHNVSVFSSLIQIVGFQEKVVKTFFCVFCLEKE